MSDANFNRAALSYPARAASIDVRGNQPGLFPFDAFEFDDPNTNENPILKMKSPWSLEAGGITIGGIGLDALSDQLLTGIETAMQRSELNETRIANHDGQLNISAQSITLQAEDISLLTTSVDGNTADIVVNGDEIDLRVKSLDPVTGLPASTSGIKVNASGVLIGNTLQSDTFVAGTSGWQIKDTGDAAFNNGIFRGDIFADGGSFSGVINATSGSFTGSISSGPLELSTGTPASLTRSWASTDTVYTTYLAILGDIGLSFDSPTDCVGTGLALGIDGIRVFYLTGPAVILGGLRIQQDITYTIYFYIGGTLSFIKVAVFRNIYGGYPSVLESSTALSNPAMGTAGSVLYNGNSYTYKLTNLPTSDVGLSEGEVYLGPVDGGNYPLMVKGA